MKKVKIALLGLGNVGSGVWKILKENEEEIMKRSGCKIEIDKILVRNKNKNRNIDVPEEIITTDFNEILEDDSIKIVVEVMGGIKPAKEYIIKCIEKKKQIVTANKMLLAIHGDELYDEADKHGVMFKYEASVAGGIPIIQAVNESLTANRIQELYGIVNGTTNFILSKMELEESRFEDVLTEAQEKGYAEADPTSDIEGFDAQYKLAVLSSLCFGTRINVDKVYREGITKITDVDMEYAKSFGMAIKLLAIAKEVDGKLELRVHPTMIPETHPLANVYDSFNAVFVKGNAVGDLMFYGRGAGDLPTGSAVLSDVISIVRAQNSDNQVSSVKNNLWNKEVIGVEEIETRYYIRATVADESGVLGDISAVFGKYNVSLKSVIQKGVNKKENKVDLVLVTHKTKEVNMSNVLDELKKINSVQCINNLIRIEKFE